MSKIQVVVAVVAVLIFTTRLAGADDVAPDGKDRATAFALSTGGTAVSVATIGNGTIVVSGTNNGPSGNSTRPPGVPVRARCVGRYALRSDRGMTRSSDLLRHPSR